jgi:hypothetical protein
MQEQRGALYFYRVPLFIRTFLINRVSPLTSLIATTISIVLNLSPFLNTVSYHCYILHLNLFVFVFALLSVL